MEGSQKCGFQTPGFTGIIWAYPKHENYFHINTKMLLAFPLAVTKFFYHQALTSEEHFHSEKSLLKQ